MAAVSDRGESWLDDGNDRKEARFKNQGLVKTLVSPASGKPIAASTAKQDDQENDDN
jgi:hypothetical protein